MIETGQLLRFPEELDGLRLVFRIPLDASDLLKVRSTEVCPNDIYVESLNNSLSDLFGVSGNWIPASHRFILVSFSERRYGRVGTRFLPSCLFVPGSFYYDLLYAMLHGTNQKYKKETHDWSKEGF